MQIYFNKDMFKLKGVKLIKSWLDENNFYISLKEVQSSHECPHCHSITSKIHEHKKQRIKDIPLYTGTPTTIILDKIRYKCNSCGCTFYNTFDFLPKNYSMTTRLIAHIKFLFENKLPMSTIAKFCNVSTNVVQRLLALFSVSNETLPTVLSIDEFKGNSGGNKYNAVVVDGEKHKIIDVLSSRKLSDLRKYFKSFPASELNKVMFFTCDMYIPYINMAKVYLKNATIIIDRFHIAKQIETALDNVRIRFQRSLLHKQSTKLKNSKLLLSSKSEKIKNKKKLEKLNFILANCPEELRVTYIFKERLLNIIHCKDFHSAKKALSDWIFEAQNTNIPELISCANTYSHFFKEICNAFKYPFSNGVTEGFNNKIKSLKRIFFGMPNFENFRTRILLA